MISRLYTFFACLLFSINLLSQTPVVEWLIDDSLMIDFDIDSEDNIVVLNKVINGYAISKYSEQGKLSYTFTDSLSMNDPKKIIIDHSDNYYILGNQRSYDTTISYYVGQGINKKYDFYHTSFTMVKYDESGTRLNKIEYPSSSSVAGININSLTFDTDNSLIVLANTLFGDTVKIGSYSIGWREMTYPSGRSDFNIKIDSSGNPLWLLIYSDYYFAPEKTVVDLNHHVITVGSSRWSNPMLDGSRRIEIGNYGGADGIIVKYDASGDFIWAEHIGSTGYDKINDVSVNGKNQLSISMWFSDTLGKYQDYTIQSNGVYGPYDSKFIVSIDENGQLLWSKPLAYNSPESGTDIQSSQMNNILCFNFYDSLQYADFKYISDDLQNIAIIKTDITGNTVWSKIFHSTVYYHKALTDHRENAYLLGFYHLDKIDRFPLKHEQGMFLCKLSNDNLIPAGNENATIENHLTVYPNPTSSIVYIESEHIIRNAILRIYNINGQELAKWQISNQNFNIDISDYKNGLYFLQLVSNQGIMIRKILKQK